MNPIAVEVPHLILAASTASERRGWRCPGEARLVAFAEGALAGAARGRVERHLAGCAYCRGQVGFLVRAGELGPVPAVPLQLLARARGEGGLRMHRLQPATVAVVAAGLALALLVVTPHGREMPIPVVAPGAQPESTATGERTLRNGTAAAGVPAILAPVEGQLVPRTAIDFRWRELPGTLDYTVEIVNSQGDVVWEGRSETAHLAVPAAAALQPGQTYFAWTLAHLRSGGTARSAVVGFRVALE